MPGVLVIMLLAVRPMYTSVPLPECVTSLYRKAADSWFKGLFKLRSSGSLHRLV